MSGGTLTTFVFEVVAESGCVLPWFPGHETRGGFLRAVKCVDEGLAGRLHSGVEAGVRGRRAVMSLKALRMVSGVRWVRVEDEGRSPLRRGLGSRMGFKALVEAGGRGWFSVTLLDEGVARDSVSVLPSLMGGEVVVGECRFRVSSLSIEVVATDKLWGDAPGEWGGIDLYFITPTYLNPLRGDAQYKILYPELTALLGNLVAIARHVTRRSYPKPEELANHVYVAGLDIKTPRTKSGASTPTGFVGWVKIRSKKDAPKEAMKLIAYLLKLSEKTNLGGNRSAGYGETKVEVSTQSNPNEAGSR